MDCVVEDTQIGAEELEKQYRARQKEKEQRKLLKGSEYEELICDSKDELVKCSTKMYLFDKLVVRLKEEGHRVLVFSQFTVMLDILEKYVEFQGWKWKRLDGQTNRIIRELDIRDFNAPDSSFFIYLISTKAGGLGLNLASADTVIIYDSDWNPQNDKQAIARAHRIGQTKPVTIYRLISEETVEERIVQRAQKKLYLNKVVVDQDENKKGSNTKLTMKEMISMLTFGSQFTNEGIDIDHFSLEELLERSRNRIVANNKQAEKVILEDVLDPSECGDNILSKLLRQASGLIAKKARGEKKTSAVLIVERIMN
eukprot:TRINITY_DN4501_c0_g1_i1.p1 TRINITY_DN4501_c0_g1~~TRINITY_DN4501_c0_g1_i1.p1  ORF type:complete len:345 (-),score=83.68 TRINITY_DN4501_c0_g1_i1:247-1182(-)